MTQFVVEQIISVLDKDSDVVVVFGLLHVPACKVYLRDGSAETIIRAAAGIEVANSTFYLTQLQCTDTGAVVCWLLNVLATC